MKFHDFACADTSVHFRDSVYQGVYVIRSQQIFDSLLVNSSPIQLDFSRYALLIGQIRFSSAVTLKSEKMNENCNEIR